MPGEHAEEGDLPGYCGGPKDAPSGIGDKQSELSTALARGSTKCCGSVEVFPYGIIRCSHRLLPGQTRVPRKNGLAMQGWVDPHDRSVRDMGKGEGGPPPIRAQPKTTSGRSSNCVKGHMLITCMAHTD